MKAARSRASDRARAGEPSPARVSLMDIDLDSAGDGEVRDGSGNYLDWGAVFSTNDTVERRIECLKLRRACSCTD